MALFESQQNTKKRHIISMKSRGFLQTPQEIMEEYNGYSVPQYTAYGRDRLLTRGCTMGEQCLNLAHLCER